jgi:hypothetical protein
VLRTAELGTQRYGLSLAAYRKQTFDLQEAISLGADISRLEGNCWVVRRVQEVIGAKMVVALFILGVE